MSDTPASRVVSLQSPVETASWVILKEGFLTKSKLAKGLLPSSKLRYFVLKQDSATLEARLEYYEGMLFRGSCALDCAAVKPASKPGTFSIVTRKRGGDRTITLQADAAHVEDATKWVIAIKQAALAKVKTAAERASQVVPDVAGVVHSGATRHRHASGEIDGVAIDNARWAALMKRQQQTQEEEMSVEDMEEIEELRRMEEEEERRQEQERVAFLADRNATQHATDDDEGKTQDSPEDVGDLSEDEEDWFAEMQKAEEEEMRRQEEERVEWMARQGTKE